MQKIPVKIRLIGDNSTLPTYHSSEAAGFDLSSRLAVTIPPHTVEILPLGFALDLPSDYWLLVTARSSLHKKGLLLANGVGVGDPDYRGPDDEYRLILYNFSAQPVTISPDERLAQGIIMPRLTADFQPVTTLAAANRGGLGSTGK